MHLYSHFSFDLFFQMIEKLSVAAPDAQMKTKILSAIALEHKINWDPKTSGENEEKPPEDLLVSDTKFDLQW